MSDATLARAYAAIEHLRDRPRLTPGALVYQAYHRPVGWLKRVAASGATQTARGALARRWLRSRVVSGRLQAPAQAEGRDIPLDLLTGRKFYAESAVAAQSLIRHSATRFALNFYDDGTLEAAHAAALTRMFPGARIHFRAEIESRLAQRLPAGRFPILNSLRGVFVLIKKLTDLAVAQSGWRLYLDSDILFFGKPVEMLDLVADRTPFHLVDPMTCYGAPAGFLSEICGSPVHPRVNTGLYFRDVGSIDWDFVEHAARQQLARFGFSYFLEQGLAAELLAREGAVPLGDEYLVLPSPSECEKPQRQMHHYVNQSRWAFYVNAARAIKAIERA